MPEVPDGIVIFILNSKMRLGVLSMNTKKILLESLFLGGVLALVHLAFAKVDSSKPARKPSSYTAIETYIEEQRRRLKIPGAALAIVEGDKIVHVCGFGKARPNGEVPTQQTPFFIGSLTKSFTALAVMQLVEAGKIELDTPVQHYLPWFKVADLQASVKMTVRHLLNQTSGFPMLLGMANLDNLDNRQDALERQVRALSSLKLNRPVGTKFEYSNLNYNVLGLIIEAASGESYEPYIEKHVFKPLGMSHSFTSKVMAKQNGMAVGHRYWFGIPIASPNLPVPRSSLPSGQLISSVEDMAHYLIANLNGGRYLNAQILSSAGIDELHHGAAEINEMGMSLGFYGMGWIDQKTGETRIISHSGIVPDYGAYMALVPETKKGIVLLVNANHAMLKMTLDEVGMGMAQRLAGERLSPMRFSAAPWLMRAMLLIPILQTIGVFATLRNLRRWRRNPQIRPSIGRLWGPHILLPLIPNLLIAITILPMLGKMRGFVKLFMPDFSWVARICGGFAGIWVFLRSGLILRTLRKDL
jgi:CubicO group peptidase (beta-lactamase class C family)